MKSADSLFAIVNILLGGLLVFLWTIRQVSSGSWTMISVWGFALGGLALAVGIGSFFAEPRIGWLINVGCLLFFVLNLWVQKKMGI